MAPSAERHNGHTIPNSVNNGTNALGVLPSASFNGSQNGSTAQDVANDFLVDRPPGCRWDGLVDNAVTRETPVLKYNRDPNRSILDMFSMRGKVAAVTGGTRGIGRAAAEGLAEAGCNLAIIYVSMIPEKADGIAKSIGEKHKVVVHAYKSDVSDPESINACLTSIHHDFGRLDTVIANAGIGRHLSCLDTPVDLFLREQAVNYHGAFYTAQATGKIFKKQGFGSLIFTASMSGSIVNLPQSQASYNSSKAAVIHLAKCLAIEWMSFARVNCVSPGYFYTDMVTTLDPELTHAWKQFSPARRFGNVGELKGAYVYLASDASSFTTGLDMIVDGGYVLP